MLKCRVRSYVAFTIVTLLLFGDVPFGRAAEAAATGGRRRLSLDQDWRFHLGDLTAAEKPEMADADWRTLDVPHDFSIEGPPGTDPATMDGPFDQKSPGGNSAGALNGGIGWYRKTITLPEGASGKCVSVQFDGVYMDSDIWLNGAHLGKQPYGYTSFRYNLTPQLKPGTNVLAVRVNVQQPCSRWYSGAGIYRHVWLTITDLLHVAPWGTYVTTPEVADAAAQVRIRTQVQNDGAEAVKATLTTTIIDADGRKIAEHQAAEQIATGGSYEFDHTIKVENPRRWSLDKPYLYQVISEVRVGDRLVDSYETPLGIRTLEFTADNGFLLNGKRVQIKGVNNHHDLGCLGAAVHRRGIERQLEILKAMGCNAIRTSHNPPAPELLELCDRMGLVVMDEIFDEWLIPKSGMKYGYKRFFEEWSERDLVSMIRRDRNHPCIILWSIGNEIKEQAALQGGVMAQRLADICHREDPTRLVTSGVNKIGPAIKNGFTKALEVVGINYFTSEYTNQRGQVLVASETSSALSTRGEYGLELNPAGQVAINKRANNQCVSYDLDRPSWGCTAEASLLAVKNAPWIAGEFVWTGFDYLGEPTPYDWPARSSYFGIVDLAGFPKDRYYLYQSQWTDKPVIHLLPHWNWKGFEGKEIPVWCFTSAESVELLLNGKSLGSKDFKDTNSLHLEWKVPYEPGVLKAVGKKGGQTLIDEVRTAGEPARLLVRPDRRQIAADGEDLSYVEVRIVDKDGNLCPNADNQVVFGLEGPGTIAGVDNGDPTNHEPFKAAEHKAFHGLCLAVIKAARTPGEIRLSVTAEGLQSEPVTISVGQDQTISLTLDANNRGAVISPLLFGHNLEVTRRAVWRGLGAEMVANRKFAAVSNGLPQRWYSIPDAGGVAMDNQVIFVGKGAVRLGSQGLGNLGQQQESLAFRKGTRYVFRWRLKSEADRSVWMRIADDKGIQAIVAVEATIKPGDWQLWTSEFVASATAENARLEIGSKTPGVFWIGAASVQPADAFHGMRRDVIELLKQLKPGGLRFPGGCYAEFYRWQDGLLPVDRRPPIGPTDLGFLLPDTDQYDTQELGIDEFVALCREISCEPALTVRLSETQPEDAAAWVEYCNGGPETKWGRLRIERGHQEPYGVKTWFLGNELYYFGRGGMKDAANCARQTKVFAEAMKRVDPLVRLVGCTYTSDWNKPLLEQAGKMLSYGSVHDYVLGAVKAEDMQAVAQAPTRYLRPLLKKAHDELLMPAIFDEWNTMWGQPGTAGMGLYAAGVLNLLCREAETLGIEQAYYFQPVTEGAIKVTPLIAELDAAGKVFAAFKVHQGNRLLKLPPLPANADLDVCASVNADGRRVYATIINRSIAQDRTLELQLTNLARPLRASARLLMAKDVTPHQAIFIEREERPAVIDDSRLVVKLPRYSVTVLELTSGDE